MSLHLHIDEIISGDYHAIINDCLDLAGVHHTADRREHVRHIMDQTELLLSREDVRRAIGDVATELLEKTALTGAQVLSIVARHVDFGA